MEIRSFTVKYSKRKAKIVKSEEMALLERVNELQAKAAEKKTTQQKHYTGTSSRKIEIKENNDLQDKRCDP